MIEPRDTTFPRSGLIRVLLLALTLLTAKPVLSATLFQNEAVNVTPSGFSVAARVPSLSVTDISLYADAEGKTNLAGVVGIQYFPLNSGSPEAITAYEQRQRQSALVQKTKRAGMFLAKVTRCQPATTYYYRLHNVGTNGHETLIPASGPLPAVTTSTANSFITHSRQLIVELPGDKVEGLIVTLANDDAPHKLASFVGDGVRTNQVFFNLGELAGGAGETNLDFLGDHEFVVEPLGGPDAGSPNLYTLTFPPGFTVGNPSFDSLNLFTLEFGSLVLAEGQSGVVPISYATRSAVNSLSFVFDVPAGRLSNLSLQPQAPEILTASLQPLSATRSLATFIMRPGQSLQGTQELARLSFTAVSGLASTAFPLLADNVVAIKPDSSPVGEVLAEPGRITIIGQGPLLVANLGPNVARTLTLYGKQGAKYQLQYTFDLKKPITWSNWTTVTLSGISSNLNATKPTNAVVFFNAFQTLP